MKKIKEPFLSKDIFVLIDEGHRTQHGTFNVEMEKALPHACFIAMTGTPLFKKDKSTATKFGGVIDAYTVDQAVKDKAVVPLLYEGRLSRQSVNDNPMDTFFEMISEPFNEYQKAESILQNYVYEIYKNRQQLEHHTAYFYLGIAKYELKKYDEAIAIFDKALKIYPNFSDVKYYKHICLMFLGQNEQAKELYAQVKEDFKLGYKLNEDNTIYEIYPYQLQGYFVGF